MTHEEYIDWRQDPRTKQVMEWIKKECYDISVVLAGSAGLDSLQDRYSAGIIRGLEKVLEIEFDEEIEANV